MKVSKYRLNKDTALNKQVYFAGSIIHLSKPYLHKETLEILIDVYDENGVFISTEAIDG